MINATSLFLTIDFPDHCFFATLLLYLRKRICHRERMKQLSLIFKALADESRLRILNLLFQSGELCVCDIESILRFTQTKVSRHMRYLKRIGLIDDRKQGRWVLYSIARPKTAEQEAIIASVKTIIESHTQSKKDTAALLKNISSGCCATFTQIKPNQAPILQQI